MLRFVLPLLALVACHRAASPAAPPADAAPSLTPYAQALTDVRTQERELPFRAAAERLDHTPPTTIADVDLALGSVANPGQLGSYRHGVVVEAIQGSLRLVHEDALAGHLVAALGRAWDELGPSLDGGTPSRPELLLEALYAQVTGGFTSPAVRTQVRELGWRIIESPVRHGDLRARAVTVLASIAAPDDFVRLYAAAKADPGAHLPLAGFGCALVEAVLADVAAGSLDGERGAALLGELDPRRCPSAVERLLGATEPALRRVGARASTRDRKALDPALGRRLLADADADVAKEGLAHLASQGKDEVGKAALTVYLRQASPGSQQGALYYLEQDHYLPALAALRRAPPSDPKVSADYCRTMTTLDPGYHCPGK